MMIGYSLLCITIGMHAAKNDEVEKKYYNKKLKLAYAGNWGDLWAISKEYKQYQLLQASCNYDWDKVKAIVTKYRDSICLNTADSQGNFPLWCAAQAQRSDIIHFLLEQGANPNRRFKSEQKHMDALRYNGSTALFEVAYQSDVQSALILLDGGARPDVTNKVGSTPVLAAVQAGCIEMVQLLLRRGASPNVQEEIVCVIDCDPPSVAGGDTPLIIAAKKNNLDMLQVLLSGGANNIKARDFSWRTAYSYAVLHHNDTMCELLAKIKCGECKDPKCKVISFVRPNMWID